MLNNTTRGQAIQVWFAAVALVVVAAVAFGAEVKVGTGGMGSDVASVAALASVDPAEGQRPSRKQGRVSPLARQRRDSPTIGSVPAFHSRQRDSSCCDTLGVVRGTPCSN